MSDRDAVIDLLMSIDKSLKQIVSQSRASAPKRVADDRDLDGPYGNPLVRGKDPRDWQGPPMMGRTFSECPPEYLDLLAERYEYFADVAEREGKTTSAGKPVAPYNRADAARARGWAQRIRAGKVTQKLDDSAPDWAQADLAGDVETDADGFASSDEL